MKKVLWCLPILLLFLAAPASGQITWTKVWSTPAGPAPQPYYNGYHSILYDAFTGKTWLYTTDSAGGGQSIYSVRLHYFDSTSFTDTFVADHQPVQGATGGCLPDSPTFPYTHHPFQQMFVDKIRHRLYTFQGVCGAYAIPEMWYYPLTNPISGTTWKQVTGLVHMPYTTQLKLPTTLSAPIADTVTTTVSLASNVQACNGTFIKVGTEIMQITGGSCLWADGGPRGPVTVTVLRGLLGTTKATALAGATVNIVTGLFDEAAIVHDTDHDAFILLGYDQGNNSQAMQVYCDTSINPTPGTLTAAQTSVGCANPDDWTNITPLVGIANLPTALNYPVIEYDTTRHKIIMFAGLLGQYIQQNETWLYDPVAKVWTSTNPKQGTYTPVASSGNVTFDFSVSNSLSLTLSTDTASSAINLPSSGAVHLKICQPAVGGPWTFVWPSNFVLQGQNAFSPINNTANDCVAISFASNGTTATAYAPMNSSANNENGLVAHAFNPRDGKFYYHLTTHTPGAGTAPTFPPQDWAYDPGTNAWTQLSSGEGPILTETMTYDAGANALIAWANSVNSTGIFQASAIAEIWVGTFGGAAIAPQITSTSPLVAGAQGTPYSASLNAAGAAPMTWTLASGALPPGLTLNSSGTINGTPTTQGTFTFSASVSNSVGSAGPATFSLTIGAPGTASGGSGGGGRGGGGVPPTPAVFPVSITVQEALYPGSVPGIARTNEPFCQGIPLADSMGVKSTASLNLTGASAAQFRMLGVWPSGNYKWIEVCGIVPSLSAGGRATVTLTNTGSGNFGGANLATDNGSTITVNTGAATFTIKKANFNVVDQVVIGPTAVVASGTSQGLVILGPNPAASYPANVTCGTAAGQSPCTTVFSSANDPNSTCTIEKNGPVQAVVSCTGSHVDSAGNVYMHFTVREYFYQGKTNVKITTSLRNADYGTSNTFATAYKGHQGYELRITPNISTVSNTFTIANDTPTPTTGSVSGTGSVYLYQGESQSLRWQDWCNSGSGCVTFTNDTGYSIVNNGAVLLSGTDTQYPQGWADISDPNGVGVSIGVYQLSAYWPKSLEFNNGGTDVRIGIWARENSQPYYQAWPQYSTHDLYLNFHSAAPSPSTAATEFLKFQHYLLARAAFGYYNSTGVFLYAMSDPSVEDSFYKRVQQIAPVPTPTGSAAILAASPTAPMVLTLASSSFASSLSLNENLLISGAAGIGCAGMNSPPISQSGYTITAISGATVTIDFNGTGCVYTSSSATAKALPSISASQACCLQDYGTANVAQWPLPVYRFYGWHTGGGDNQSEFRWSYLMNFITRGMSGRYLKSSHFYRFLADSAWPRSDGFNWRDRPDVEAAKPELDTFARPTAASANSSLASGHADWLDQEHGHWYGMPDYYFLSGDETIKDAILNGPKDYFLNEQSAQAGKFGGMDGRVNTNGTQVTLALGPNFDNSMLLGPMFVGTTQYKVQSITDATHLVLTTSAGTQTFAPWSSWGGLANARSVGVNLMGAARLSKFLAAIGDTTSANAVLDLGAKDYMMQVNADICVSGYPTVAGAPCVSGPTAPEGNWKTEGISRTRGLVMDGANQTFLNPWCGDQNRHVRYAPTFFINNLIQGVLEFRNAEGAQWSEYLNSLDLAYGMSRWALSEMYVDDGTGRWDANGFRYYEAIDLPGSCADTTHVQDYHTVPQEQQTVSFTFLPKYMVDGDINWAQKFDMNLQRDMSALGTNASDFYSIQPAHIIGIINNPTQPLLEPVSLSKVVDNGGGSYTISWVVPARAASYRIKWGPKTIVDWIGFDPINNVFTGDPVNTMPWFAATNVPTLPVPAAGGTTQSLTISTGTVGLKASNFSVKAYIAGTSGNSGGGSGSGGSGGGGGSPGPPIGSAVTAAISSSTKFQIDVQDLSSAVAACTTCSFQSAADLMAGQTTEVQLVAPGSNPSANVISLKQGAVNGSVTVVGTNQFVIQTSDGSPWPSSILVLTSGATEFLNFSGSPAAVKVGQSVAVRGLLFKSGPQGGPTIVARRIQAR
jgi:hypothetical protein